MTRSIAWPEFPNRSRTTWLSRWPGNGDEPSEVQQPGRCHPHAPGAPAFQRGRRVPAHKPVPRKNEGVRPAQGTEGYQVGTMVVVWAWQGA